MAKAKLTLPRRPKDIKPVKGNADPIRTKTTAQFMQHPTMRVNPRGSVKKFTNYKKPE